MKNHFQSKLIIPLFLFFLMAFFLSLCKEKTEKDLILELVDSISRFAEEKDVSSLMMNLADDYSDFQGRGKGETEDMLKYYYEQYKGIVIHMLSTRIDEINLPQASIQTEVALSSGAAKVFRKLTRYSPDNYRFRIGLVKKNDRWQIQYAEWKYVSLEELYPESLFILKRIFPDE